MGIPGNLPYYSLNNYYKKLFGTKVYKISLNCGFSCPNRDGKLSEMGCIFCSEGGSGDFASPHHLSIKEQILEGKKRIANKYSGNKYIAYFQAYTNTYAPLPILERYFNEAIESEEIIGLSIATRPDCIDKDVITLLKSLNARKKVWIELGLQTKHDSTAEIINRGYSLDCFETALQGLNEAAIDTVIHLILGLPSETSDHMLDTIRYISRLNINGIKLQLLHVLKNTKLADMYYKNEYTPLAMEQYIGLVVDCIERLPSNMVIHRITGDGPKKILIAPKWSSNKKVVLNTIMQEFKKRNTWQGKFL